MESRVKRVLFLLLMGLGFGPGGAQANLLGELSSADQARIKAGEQVMLTEPIDGYPWPRVIVYQKAPATPREVMAVFFDYDNASHYIPNCLKSAISKEIDPLDHEVDYVIDVPILPDEAYTALNTLSAPSPGVMKAQWRVLKATSIEESRGSLVVEPTEGGSLLRYTNLVKPASRAAIILRGVAMNQMKDTVQALVGEVRLRMKNPAGLRPELARLDTALGKTATP